MNLLLEKKYFDKKLSRGFWSLYSSRMLEKMAFGFFSIFLPVFLYQIFGNNFQMVATYYLVGNIAYGLLVSVGAKFLSRFGFRKALRLSTFFGASFHAILYFVNDKNLLYLIPFSVITLVLYRLLHWIPFHVDFAKFTDKCNRCREVGLFEATSNFIGIFTPFFAGFIISRFDFSVLFIFAVILYASAFIPLLNLPKTREKFSWTIVRTWKEFFSKKRRRTVLALMADGAEGAVGFVVWPVFMFEILKGNHLQVGIVSTLILGLTVVLQLTVGKIGDKKIPKKKILNFGSVLYSLGWIFKIFIATAFHIFIFDSFHKFVKIFLRIPFDALTYELAADQGHYIDEFTVIREMAINIGRSLGLFAVILISIAVSLKWTFILGAFVAICYNIIRAKQTSSPFLHKTRT